MTGFCCDHTQCSTDTRRRSWKLHIAGPISGTGLGSGSRNLRSASGGMNWSVSPSVASGARAGLAISLASVAGGSLKVDQVIMENE